MLDLRGLKYARGWLEYGQAIPMIKNYDLNGTKDY